MEIIFLGSGTGLPLVGRASPSLLVHTSETYALLDIGPGSLRQLALLGIPFWRLELVLITHFHPDHVNDLPHLLFALKSPAISKQAKGITVAGPEGLFRFYEGLRAIYGRWVEATHSGTRFVELRPGESLPIKDIEIRSIKTPHTENSLGIRLESQGKRIVYSGDTAFFEDLARFAWESDLLILESSFPEPREGHLSPKEAAVIAREARAKTLVLTHFYPEACKANLVDSVREIFSGELILARDMMKITLR